MNRLLVILLLFSGSARAQPDNPLSPTPLDTHEWFLLIAAMFLGSYFYLIKKRNQQRLDVKH